MEDLERKCFKEQLVSFAVQKSSSTGAYKNPLNCATTETIGDLGESMSKGQWEGSK